MKTATKKKKGHFKPIDPAKKSRLVERVPVEKTPPTPKGLAALKILAKAPGLSAGAVGRALWAGSTNTARPAGKVIAGLERRGLVSAQRVVTAAGYKVLAK